MPLLQVVLNGHEGPHSALINEPILRIGCGAGFLVTQLCVAAHSINVADSILSRCCWWQRGEVRMISPFQAIPVAKVFCGINYGVHLQTPTSRRGRASVFVPQGEVPTLNTRRSFHGHGRGWDSPRSTFYPIPSLQRPELNGQATSIRSPSV